MSERFQRAEPEHSCCHDVLIVDTTIEDELERRVCEVYDDEWADILLDLLNDHAAEFDEEED